MIIRISLKKVSTIFIGTLLSSALFLSINSRAQTVLSDQPLLTSIAVPGNLLLSLSVEYPTALSWAYPPNLSPYTPANTFIGYFDAAKCYVYQASPTDDTTGKGYFQPSGMAVGHACVSSSSSPLWSGNWLNWVSMQTIDTFRSALTGGYRSFESPGVTVLERAWASGQGKNIETATKNIIDAGYIAGATPFATWTNLSSRSWGAGNQIWISGTTNPDSVSAVLMYGGNVTPLRMPGTVPYEKQNSFDSNNWANPATVYALDVRVKVCDSAVSLESNCKAYSSGYKPEGLLQQYSQKIRIGVFGYLNDGSVQRDGGVLRANMKFIGPTQPALPSTTGNIGQPIAGTPSQTNPFTEWDAITGVMNINPNPADAITSGVANSGVINYLNKFGESAQYYKLFDPVSELYYVGIRYFKKLGNWPTYTSNVTTAMADGFPVITNWEDPILYSCQKNFILGIGDNNTHSDANLPGSTIGYSGSETSMRPNDDKTVNVTTATNMVGYLEGFSSLGTNYYYGYSSPNFIAGLAYDSHTVDTRPNEWLNTDGTTPKYYKQTVSTYWVDVWEYQTYAVDNRYYLATKYGGFNVPDGFQPYASTNGFRTLTIGTGSSAKTVPMTNAMWHTNTDTFGANLRPDNLYSGAQANVMVAGLNSAFASIVSNITGSSTAFSFTSGTVTSTNNLSYASQYNSGSWTGDVTASSISRDAQNNPTFTQIWSAQAALGTQTNRYIVSCCSNSGKAFPFQVGNLKPNNYATFANVLGVASASQSSANYLAYLRGVRTSEIGQTNANQVAGVYRTRASLLGDIVNSKLAAVGPPNSVFSDSYNPGYSSFKAAYASRKTVVYAGANDGMLHAIDGSSSGGAELFAYIPSFVYGNSTTASINGLATLGNPSFSHHYFVDGQQQVFDIDMNSTYQSTSSSPAWKSVLIGGLGKGGNGYYAIDVTDPSTWTNESAVASKVLWEFTDPRMGYSFGPPVVAKTKKYGWVMVFTSGYGNPDGRGYFFFVNPTTGALLEAVSTGVGSTTSPAGLSYASAYAIAFNDTTADSIYAGDLLGNVWRVDLTTTGNYESPTKIATLNSPSGGVQPITTQPLIEVQPGSYKRYVLIGTGQLLNTPDLSSTQVESFYAILDGTATAFYTPSTLPSGISFPITREKMVANNNLLLGIGSAPTNPMGWYIDLTTNSLGVSARMVIAPTSSVGLVAFASVTPNGDPCNPSASGTLYAVNFGTGSSILTDRVGAAVPYITQGTISNVQFVNANGYFRLEVSGNGVSSAPGLGDAPVSYKRISWRELPTAD
ncbi:pilus assembly protein [Undibacterium sp. SXout20W]|uniref:pilus assembly protein n=1 Tax=Undibacterium sp. SXout20W TaxID=3413051 RepID=UPI003BF2331B